MSKVTQLNMFDDTRAQFFDAQVRAVITGGGTKRFHTHPTLKDNTVAAHSWHVAMWVAILTGGSCSAPLLLAALTHDMAEYHTGDIPAPVKRGLGIREAVGKIEEDLLKSVGMNYDHMLNDDERRTLKLADAFDGMVYCTQERRMGNKELDSIYVTFCSYYLELKPVHVELVLFNIIDKLNLEARQ